MKINIQLQEKKEAEKYRNLILCAAEKALLFAGKENKSLSILLTNEEKIRRLNRKFRNVDKPTDVLAFPCGEKHSSYLGDIAISFTQAKRQSKIYKEKFERELARLTIHGVLHLSGETDTTDKSRKRMWDKQEKILASLKTETKRKIKIQEGIKWKRKENKQTSQKD